MKHILFSLLFTIVHLSFFAQEKQPTITGKVKISILEGTFDCDLTISNIPAINDYLIRLNSGMNLLQIRSKVPKDFVVFFDKSKDDSMSTGESFAYYLPNKTGKFLPESIQFRYVGKFPVATDTLTNYTREDWKGNIAFNGYSVRADGFQTAWYPYLYDAEKDVSYEEMIYDIDFECLDCSTIYVNGNKPVRSSKAQLKSDVPYELALFCGKYDFVDDGKLVMLNPTFSKKDLADFSELIATYKTYYEQKLAIPFSEPPVFVNTTPTSIYNGWLFVTYPTIMGIGWGNNGLGALFENDTLYRHYYKAGKLDSIANFYENGILAESVVYQNGFKNGKAIKYVRSGLNKGDIAEELFYKNDALDSIQHQYYACQNCYTANETWHKEERLITYSNRFLQGKYFLISETKEERGFYYNNQKTGQWVERAFVNGHWNTASGTYLNDRKTLVWTETIGDSLRIESFYEDGMLSGKRKTLLNNRLILEEEFASKEITEVIEYASDNSERRFILEGIEKDFVYLRYHSKKDSVISWYNCAIPLKDTLLSGNPYEPLLTKFRKNIHNESTLTPYFVNGFSIETTDYVMGGLFQNGNKDIHQIYYKQADLFEKNNPENGFWDQTYFNQNQQGPFTGQFYSAYYNEFISIKEGYRHDWTIIYNAEGKQIAKAKYVKGELKKRVEIVD
jgi:hypothetical protein